jgi:surface antigen
VRHTAAGAFAQTLSRISSIVLAAGAAAWLGGCSMALPSISPVLGDSTDDATGSIPDSRRPSQLSRALDQEDWRRASAALGTALDPQGDGSAVNWDNPQTSAKGSFTAVGQAYPTDGKICRAFIAEVGTKDSHENLKGTACREKSAEWSLSEVKPWKRS